MVSRSGPIIVFAVVASVVVVRMVALALWRRNRTVWSATTAVVGLAAICTWMFLAWRAAGFVIFAAVVVAWALSPYFYRLYRRMFN